MSNRHSFAPLPAPAPAASNSRIPGWVLLDSTVYVDDLLNRTTAGTLTKAGLTIQLSLVTVDPPRLSYFCAYCLDIDKIALECEPEVVCSVGGLALIRVDFTVGDSPQYFVYRARGPKGGPSLDLLPDIRLYSRAECLVQALGLVSHDNGQHFVVAALSYGKEDDQYILHTLCSEPRSTWSRKLLQVEIPDGHPRDSAVICPTKVISLGGGLLGWVDLWKGVVKCDVLNPVAASFIPMPKLLPSNKELYGHQSSARGIRDVTFSAGCIKCVEFEQLLQLRPPTAPSSPDPWDIDEFNDSELAVGQRPHEEEDEVYDVVGWRLVTWYRELSWGGWCKGSKVHSDDLGTTVSLPQLGGGSCALKELLKDLQTASPTLCDDDIVYLVSMTDKLDQAAWIVPVDTKRRHVGEIMPLPLEDNLIHDPTFIPCELTKYLGAKSDGAQGGKQNASHAAPSQNISKTKKQRLLSQAELGKQQSVTQLLQHSSAAVMMPVSSAQYV
ncbi:unnamed protein product [Alopecurus aequalis]